MNLSHDAWKKHILKERSFAASLTTVIDHDEYNFKLSDVAHTKTSIPRDLKVDLLNKAFDFIFVPLFDADQAGFACVT